MHLKIILQYSILYFIHIFFIQDIKFIIFFQNSVTKKGRIEYLYKIHGEIKI